MTAMEVVMIDKFGSREVMKFRKLPIPTPGPNEILLKVKAASINPVDWKIREGKVFDFHDIGSAFAYVEKGDTEGKVALKIAA